MTDREIVGIKWHPYRPDQIELVYRNGDTQRTSGTREDAERLTGQAWMKHSIAQDGTLEWWQERGVTKDAKAPDPPD